MPAQDSKQQNAVVLDMKPVCRTNEACPKGTPRAADCSGYLVLILAFTVMLVLLGLHYTICPYIRLEYIVAAFHTTVGLISSGPLRQEWKFCMSASLITFWPGDTLVTAMGLRLFHCVEPTLVHIGTIPSYMIFMWAIPYLLGVHLAYESPSWLHLGNLSLEPWSKALLVLSLIYTRFELLEPYLKIWKWSDYPTIFPIVILYESLVGTGYAILYRQRSSRVGRGLAFGLVFCVSILWLLTQHTPDAQCQPGQPSEHAELVVVGTGPGAAGFIYRLLQLHPDLTIDWLERGPLHGRSRGRRTC